MENLLNNEVVLEGYVNSEAELSHEIYGEKFYKFQLEVLRLSDNADNIIITMSERLMEGCDLSIGAKIKIYGQFRSYNNYSGEGNKLVLTVFVKRFAEEEEEEYLPNTKIGVIHLPYESEDRNHYVAAARKATEQITTHAITLFTEFGQKLLF